MNLLRNLFGKDEKDESSPPSAETLEEAKKIFFEYSCNGLYMAQNDIQFSKYRVSKEQEIAWRNEFIAYWKGQLSTEDLTAIQKLREAQAVESIPDLLGMANDSDSYAKLRIAQALAALGYLSKEKNLRQQAQATAKSLAQSILRGPVQVSERHKTEIASLGSANPEEYIITFAKNIEK